MVLKMALFWFTGKETPKQTFSEHDIFFYSSEIIVLLIKYSYSVAVIFVSEALFQ